MKNSLIIFLAPLIICLNPSIIYAASIIPICSENVSAVKNCPKNKLSFPTYSKDSSGKAIFRYQIDQGRLGEFSSEELINYTTEVLSLWSQESNIVFEKAGNGIFETNVVSSNFASIDGNEQGFNLIIWDEDGEILEDMFGIRAKEGVLGYATPIAYNFKNNKIDSIKESQALLNGFLFNRNNIGASESRIISLFRTTVLHELAHMFGLDHAQGGNLEGYNNGEGDFTDIPVMFPAAANPEVALHADDISAIKLAYPKAEEVNNFGTISGSLTQSSQPVEGANIVAYKLGETNPKLHAVSSPSDVDGLGKGNFLLPSLEPGDYVLYAEPLDSSFTEGSSIGFHEKPANFSSGFYDGNDNFLKLSYEEGLSQAQVVTVNAATKLNINIDVDGEPHDGSGNNNNGNTTASFTTGGRLINGNSISLKNKKIKKTKIKIVNLNRGTKLNIRISTNYPDLIKFAGSGSYGFKKRSKKINVRLASFLQFTQNPDFEELVDFGNVSVPVTIEDLDTGFTRVETLILE